MTEISDILTTALRLNREDFAVFVDFSGHISRCSVHYYAGGWVSGSDRTDARDFCTDKRIDPKEIEGVIAWLVSASDNNAAEQKEAVRRADENALAEYESMKRKVRKIKLKQKKA